MLSSTEFWIEAVATAAIVLLIPFYMGFIHVTPAGAAAYAGVGSIAMAVGEDLQFGIHSLQITFWDVALWGAAIAGSGGVIYLLALLLV